MERRIVEFHAKSYQKKVLSRHKDSTKRRRTKKSRKKSEAKENKGENFSILPSIASMDASP
jgi:hypothetical protein